MLGLFACSVALVIALRWACRFVFDLRLLARERDAAVGAREEARKQRDLALIHARVVELTGRVSGFNSKSWHLNLRRRSRSC